MPFCHFWKIYFSKFKMTFAKSPLKKPPLLWQIFEVLLKYYSLTKFYQVGILDSLIEVLQIIFAFCTEVRFLCLLLFLRRFYKTRDTKMSHYFFRTIFGKNPFALC